MTDIMLFASVEDEPSKETLIKIVHHVNEIEYANDALSPRLIFEQGTPWIAKGYGDIKTVHLPTMKKMAEENGKCSVLLVDLDADKNDDPCALSLIRRWFVLEDKVPITIHPMLVFRVAVREVESWLMADRKKFARFMGNMPEVNVPRCPDDLHNPKKKLFELINRYCRQTRGRMLPSTYSHIGPEYNSSLCQYIQNQWRPKEAALYSDSLKRTIRSLQKLVEQQKRQ